MKILFVYPSNRKFGNDKSKNFRLLKKMNVHVPSTLLQLVSLTPLCHDIELVDENHYEKINFEKEYDLVAITCMTMHSSRAYEIADEFCRRGVKVVLGGYHPTTLPDEAKAHADSVVIGEAEISWPKLLKDFERGSIKSFYESGIVNPELIPPVRRDFKNGYYPTGVQATRGCPFKCGYCSIQNVEGPNFRKRPIKNVIEEIKNLKTSFFSFTDPSLTIDLEYTKNLFKEVKKLNKFFDCHGNINVLNQNEDLIKLSKEAGCQTWYIGFESISKESLKSVNKSNNPDIYPEGIKKIRKHGISINGLFMFGFDGDRLDIFNRTLKSILKWKIDIASFAILTPFPGTPVFEKFESEDRLLTKDWSQYYFNNVVFQPKHMAKEDLYNNTKKITKKFYSLSNVAKRTIDNHSLSRRQFINKLNHNLADRRIVKREFKSNHQKM